jgi:hypothetical protein
MSYSDASQHYSRNDNIYSCDCIGNSTKADVHSQTSEKPLLSKDVSPPVTQFRKFGLYSQDGTTNTTITSYTDPDNVKRIIINNVDISLDEFYEYLTLIDGKQESREEFHFKETVYIGATASFVTGIILSIIILVVCVLSV